MRRRSITVHPVVERVVNSLRGALLLEGVDVDFTRMLNALALLGAYRLLSGDASEGELTLVASVLSARELAEAAPLDEALILSLERVEEVSRRVAEAIGGRRR